MTTKAIDIFLHAKSIIGNAEPNETISRLVINRAYYGTYGHLLSEVENRLFYPIDESSYGVHQKLINTFKNAKSSNAQEYKTVNMVATKLRHLRSLRVRADYELDTDIRLADAIMALGLADEILTTVEGLT